ncbi:MAG TPA: hypothetical protein VNJ01_15855 [Bacteriovoracaceae bacterium]|nr:hypothetical protein [Bacteriovoracaceae bacterium]
MYCPICFQNTLKIRSNGVIKLAFNGKAKNSSLYTYNLQKETHEQLLLKLREKIEDFMSFYSDFANKEAIKKLEIYSADFVCVNDCKIDMMSTKVSVIGLVYSVPEVKAILAEEGKKYGIDISVTFN